MSVLPNGNVSVTCSGGVVNPPPPPPPDNTNPGSFSLSGPSSLTVGTVATYTVLRSGGSAGDAVLGYATSGGCQPGGGVVNIPNGSTTGTISITAPSAAGQCVVAIGGPSIGALASPAYLNVAITAAGAPPPGPAPGCPAVPNDVLDFDLKLSGADRLVMSSGRIASGNLPGVKANGGTSSSGQVLFGESTLAPRAARIEISITKCRGEIDTTGGPLGTCYLNSSNPTFTKLEWIEREVWGANTNAVAKAYGLCKALTSEGPYFVNVRYSYSGADCQYGNCGFVQQWNYSGF